MLYEHYITYFEHWEYRINLFIPVKTQLEIFHVSPIFEVIENNTFTITLRLERFWLLQ